MPTVWKPSEKTPLSAIAVTKIAERVCRETGADPAIFTLLIGDRKTVGEPLAADRRIPLVSATGSTAMGIAGRESGPRPARPNASWSWAATTRSSFRPSADLEMAAQSIFFGAVGTAGQRCTSTRRVIVHESIADKVARATAGRLQVGARSAIRSTARRLMGPLIDRAARSTPCCDAIEKLKDGGRRSSLRRRAARRRRICRAAVT